jgi:hypothetical protein
MAWRSSSFPGPTPAGVTGVDAGGLASGSGSRRGGAAGHRRWRRWPAPARTRRPAGAARSTSAACRTGCPGVGALDHPAAANLDRRWHSTGGDLTNHPTLGQNPPARLPVIAGVQVHHWLGGQRTDHPDGVQGGRQQPVVATVGRGGQHRQRNAARLYGHRALQPLLAAVHGTGSGNLAAAGRLGGAPVRGQVLQFQAEQPVIGGQHRKAQLLGRPGGNPLVTAATQGGGRARRPGPTGVPGWTMAGQAPDLPVTAGCKSPRIITARACPISPRPTGAGPKRSTPPSDGWSARGPVALAAGQGQAAGRRLVQAVAASSSTSASDSTRS